MRVAFIGTRGVPATYSGFETFVEQLGARLVERGHDVTVYCRRHHLGPSNGTMYRGMRLVHVRGIASKHLDTASHTAVSSVHALTQRYDVVVMCISGNSPFAWIPRVTGAKVILNVDGSDWRRSKWGPLARTYIRASEWIATRTPNATVTDSKVMQAYYQERLGARTECIAYGADMPEPSSRAVLRRLDLQPRQYLLLVGRLVPDNCIHHLVHAYERLRPDLRCVIVGDAPYAEDYIRSLKQAGPHIDFTGYVFDEGYRELMHNAYATVLCSEVGGTHPVLVEAMAAGNCVVVNDTAANLEVIGDSGISYDGERGADGLYEVLRRIVADQDVVADYRERARRRVRELYSWDAVTNEYEALFARLRGVPKKARVPGAAVPAESPEL
ncbi:MAG: glycosyltransferase [Chloroflexota bacterium]